jgi:hypothetical protein
MRLTRAQVIDKLKAEKELFDNGRSARFVEPGGLDGGLCNIFTFWWLRDKGLIISRPAGHAEYPRYWRWANRREVKSS